MYMVVSHWEVNPGQEDEARRRSAAVRQVLRAQPGVEFIHSIFNGNKVVAVHGYVDESAYHRVVHDPNGAFATAIADHGLEDIATWKGSESGNTTD